MLQFENEQEKELMLESRKALDNIRAHKKSENRNTFQEFKENWKKVDKGRRLFEEYESGTFEKKLKIDLMYYNQLLENLDENIKPQVEKLFSNMYKTVNAIYEFINIKPEIYGNGVNETILEDSYEHSRKKVSKVIYEYLDRSFYSLEPEKRKEIYLENSMETAKKLITEGNDIEESIAFSVKTLVMEGLLKKISFPFTINSRINYLLEDESYAVIFEQDKLRKLVDSFDSQVKKASKIISACV